MKMYGDIADRKFRPTNASITNDLAGRVFPVFLMRDLAQQG